MGTSPQQRLGEKKFEVAVRTPAGNTDQRTRVLMEKTLLPYWRRRIPVEGNRFLTR